MYRTTSILFLTAGLHLLVGGFVFRRNPRGPVHRALLLETSFIALWAFSFGATWIVSSKDALLFCGRLAHVASLFACTGFVNLGLIFPLGRTRAPMPMRAAMWGIGIGISLSVLFTPWMVVDAEMLPDGRLNVVTGPIQYPYFAYVGACLLWAVVDLLLRTRGTRGRGRLQMGYLLLGLAFAGLLNVPSNIIAPLFGIYTMAALGPLFSLVFPVFVAHAIVRHRLMGIRVFVGRTVAYGLALLITAGVMWAGLAGMSELMGPPTQATRATGIFVALGIAVIFQPLRSWVQQVVAGYFYRPPYDYQSTVRDSSRALAGMLDLGRALGYLTDTVCQTLQVERCVVLIRDRIGPEYRIRAVKYAWTDPEQPVPEDAGLAAGSPLVTWLENTDDLVVREELDQGLPQGKGDAIAGEMSYFGADVAVRLAFGPSLLGVLLVGGKISGDTFSSQDLDLLSTLGAEGAAAIANAQLHQDAVQTERLATLGGLAAGIAHEVKNPLVAVRTFAELLPDKYGDPEFREGFSRIVLREVERIDGLIGQLLNYARPTPPRLEPVDLTCVIQETLELVGHELSRHHIVLERRYDSDLPRVMADAAQLRQAVLNIALNATQMMPGGGVLRVSTRGSGVAAEPKRAPYLLRAEMMAEMEIANSGPPIPLEHRERIFEPFFSTRSGGTGLGLSICKGIVTEHKGQIRVSETEDGLTAFIIRLPVVPAAPAAPLVPGEMAYSV